MTELVTVCLCSRCLSCQRCHKRTGCIHNSRLSVMNYVVKH